MRLVEGQKLLFFFMMLVSRQIRAQDQKLCYLLFYSNFQKVLLILISLLSSQIANTYQVTSDVFNVRKKRTSNPSVNNIFLLRKRKERKKPCTLSKQLQSHYSLHLNLMSRLIWVRNFLNRGSHERTLSNYLFSEKGH